MDVYANGAKLGLPSETIADKAMRQSAARLLKNCRLASRLTALVGVCVGFVVLVGGWAYDVTAFRVVLPGYPAMVPNTALGLWLCGVALGLNDSTHRSRAKFFFIQVCAGMAVLIGAITLAGYLSGKPLTLDGLLFHNATSLLAAPKMSITSAASFVLLGFAILLSGRRRHFTIGQYFAISAGILSLFNAIGYLYGVRGIQNLPFQRGSTAMAVHTSVTFVILCAGALLSRPDWGLISTINSPSPGGVMVRRLLPAALLLPIVSGWLRWQGQRLGYYDTAFGLTIFTSVNVVSFAVLIWRSGQILNHLDRARVRAERNMQELADAMPQIVWTAGPDGATDYYNRRCYEYCATTFEETRDGGWVAAIHPDEVQQVMGRRARAFALQKPYTMEYRFKRASDGTYRWHLARGIPIFDVEGELVPWIGTCTDIDELRASNQTLRESESQFRQLADSMPQIVWTAGPNGDLDYYNQRWHDYTGMDLEATRNWGWQPVLHPDDLQNCIERWTHSFTTCELLEIEYRFRRASDGAYRWHLGRARPIRDGQGVVARWFGTCTDIHDYKLAEIEIKTLNLDLERRVRERTAELDRANQSLLSANEAIKRSAAKLEENNRELQDFASVASHDLQEPLRKVQAYGGRLKTMARDALDEQSRDHLDRMLNATERMQSLIRDLLKFARITNQTHRFAPVELGQVMREVLSDLEVRIGETGAILHVGALPAIDADATQMRQLLQNLVSNAMKFRQQGKPPLIRVFAEQAGEGETAAPMVRLVVQDEGVGFDETQVDRIFKMFQRLHGRSEYEGTGVGLAICHKIAERHGGSISATSTLGVGSSFCVELPLRQRTGKKPPAPVDSRDHEFIGHQAALSGPAECG